MSDSLWIILVGSLVAINCSLVGNFLILRKSVMLGDALSHAVLPGMVMGYFYFGENNLVGVLGGAALAGLILVVAIEWLKSSPIIKEDATIGLIYTALFSIGVILVSLFASQVHLDQEHVLYGEIAYVPLDRIYLGDSDIGPRSFWVSLALLGALILLLRLSFKGFNLTSFDPEFASSKGIRTRVWNYFLMVLVTAVVVVSFENVGAILVVAFLVAPGAIALLWSHRMSVIFVLSTTASVVIATGGFFLAEWSSSSVSGAMAFFSGILFIFAWSVRKLVKR
jgi:manganese/zinc/iron transport system permease protein